MKVDNNGVRIHDWIVQKEEDHFFIQKEDRDGIFFEEGQNSLLVSDGSTRMIDMRDLLKLIDESYNLTNVNIAAYFMDGEPYETKI